MSPSTLLEPQRLPHALYRAVQARALDRYSTEEGGIPSALLMERAGAAAWRLVGEQWPQARTLTVLCGIGNNGGDGYVLARLALAAGVSVQVLQLGDPARLSGDALEMARRYQILSGAVSAYTELPRHTDVLVDAVFGTGLEREVSCEWAQALEAINHHTAPVLALDLPSGLHADTGQILGVAVRADHTLSFIALKQGLFTGKGPDCAGQVHFAGLGVPARIYARELLSARRVDWRRQVTRLHPRRRTAHKGSFGHVLVIGGALGLSGAARLAAEGALRGGAGLVTLATHPEHAALANLMRPELMCHGVANATDLVSLLERATVVAVGPGLSRNAWGRALWTHVQNTKLPLVVDADALNFLAKTPVRRDNWILTPHPGEAARLLDMPVTEVQQDRFAALDGLVSKYGGVVVLKGAGTLISSVTGKPPALCSDGNPGMASGGMGDLLTGLIAAFLAQGWEAEEAAGLGVCLHAAAADVAAASGGERGLLASDLLAPLRRLLNPGFPAC